VSSFPAFFHQEPPSEHDVFGNWQNPLIEHGPYLLCELIVQLIAPQWMTLVSWEHYFAMLEI
jgi:hypothetical protein